MGCGKHNWISGAVVFAAIIGLSRVGLAQDDVRAEFESLYTLGTHQYFSDDWEAAYETLAKAKMVEPNDPRAYYFRGLAAYRLGYDGRFDFEVGARIEARVAGAATLVNRSLERVQGPLRLVLEEYRLNARLEAKREANRGRARG